MDYSKEKFEAIQAGERALNALYEASRQISGAKGFGLWDLFGGGTFVSLAKHYKINNAKNAIQAAKINLSLFSNELHDLQMIINIDISNMLSFFDIWDNWIADIMVQSKLSDAQNRINQAIIQVQQCLDKLRNME